MAQLNIPESYYSGLLASFLEGDRGHIPSALTWVIVYLLAQTLLAKMAKKQPNLIDFWASLCKFRNEGAVTIQWINYMDIVLLNKTNYSRINIFWYDVKTLLKSCCIMWMMGTKGFLNQNVLLTNSSWPVYIRKQLINMYGYCIFKDIK